jgi:hypothetical protein
VPADIRRDTFHAFIELEKINEIDRYSCPKIALSLRAVSAWIWPRAVKRGDYMTMPLERLAAPGYGITNVCLGLRSPGFEIVFFEFAS